MRITRRNDLGHPVEVVCKDEFGDIAVFRITGITLQKTYKVDQRPWYDVPDGDWLKFSPDQLRGIACLLDGLAYGEDIPVSPNEQLAVKKDCIASPQCDGFGVYINPKGDVLLCPTCVRGIP